MIHDLPQPGVIEALLKTTAAQWAVALRAESPPRATAIVETLAVGRQRSPPSPVRHDGTTHR